MSYAYTTQAQVRAAFWRFCGFDQKPRYARGRRQNDFSASWRQGWCDYVDSLQKNGEISESLAARVTL